MRYDYLTFDCYGTLVDWRRGILAAFAGAAGPDGGPPDPERLLALHARHEAEVEAGPYRSYREVLTETARRMSGDLGLAESSFRPDRLAASLPRWPVFPETVQVLEALGRAGARLGILSNVDDDLLAATLEQLEVEFDLLITAQQVGSYKPAPGHFRRARERIGAHRWLHVAQSQFHDLVPCRRLGIPAVWINRLGERPAAGIRPLAALPDLTGLPGWLA